MPTPADGVCVLRVSDGDAPLGDPPSLDGVAGQVTVERVSSVAGALDSIDDVDCVVTDYGLPDGDGVELIEAVRSACPDLPVVLCPVDGSEAVASEAVAAGVTEYVPRDEGEWPVDAFTDRVLEAGDSRRADGATVATEAMLTELVERTDDVLYVVSPDWSELLFVNSSYEEVWGRSVAELEADPTAFLDHVHPEDVDRARESIERLASGDPDEVEYRVVTEDGVRWVRGESRPVFDDDGDVKWIVGSVTDVTERRERERDLRRERDRSRAVFEEAFDAMVVADDDGQHVDANESAADLFGLPREELLGRSIEEFTPPEYDFDAAWRAFQASGDERDTFPLLTAGGEHRTVEFAATTDVVPGRHLSVIRDVTGRIERERRLEQRERRYRNLVEGSPAPINLFDEDGEVVWGNDAVLDLLGLERREDLVGTAIFEYIHPDDHATAKREMGTVFDDDEPVGPTDFRIVREDGEVRHIRVSTSVGWFEGERVGQAVVVDVTDRERTEEMLTALNEGTRAMTRAESTEDVAATAVDTVADVLDLDGAVYLSFEGGDRLVPVARTGTLVDRDGGVGLADEDSALWEAFLDGTGRYWTDGEAETTPGPFDSALALPIGTHGLLVGGVETAWSPTGAQRNVGGLVAESAESALDRVDRTSALRERDRQLERQNRDLEQLNRLNEIIREINQALVRSSSREGIRESVCDSFATADQYAFAWVANRTVGDDSAVPVAWSGVDAELVDGFRSPERFPTLHALVDAAFRENEVQVATNVLGDADWADHRRTALTYGYRAVAAVPVVRRDSVESVLVIHAETPETLDPDEQRVLAELGETIGYALGNVERQRLGQSDEHVEIELETSAGRLFTNRLTTRVATRAELLGAVPEGSDTVRAFVRFDGMESEAEERLSAFETVRAVRVLSETEDSCLSQITVETPPLLEYLQTSDADLETLTADRGTTTMTVALGDDVGVRSFVEGFESMYPDTRLVARRRRTDTLDTRETFRAEIVDRLTDRQFDALRTAHYGGFYEWPRESTSAELAETRDIAPSTFQYHLRAAERKLVSAILD